MEEAIMMAWGNFGAAAALCLAATGSALGAGTAGPAAIGAWKKAYAQGKPAVFTLVTFVGRTTFTNHLWHDPHGTVAESRNGKSAVMAHVGGGGRVRRNGNGLFGLVSGKMRGFGIGRTRRDRSGLWQLPDGVGRG